MKFKYRYLLIIITIALCNVNGAKSQHINPLPQDQHGKITFSEVVSVEHTSQELLYHHALGFVQRIVDNSKNLKKKSIVKDEPQEVYIPLAFTVYQEFPLRSPHGVIKYDFKISLKDGRYRYLATNFVFHYLKRNRYGKFMEVSGQSKPLEDPFFKGNQKLWDQHQQKVLEKIEKLTTTLKSMMMIPEAGPQQEVVKVNDNW